MRQHWKLGLAAGLVLVFAIAFPVVAGALAKRALVRKAASWLAAPLAIGRARAGLSQVTFYDLSIDDPSGVKGSVARLTAPWAALWGGGTVWVETPYIEAPSLAALKRLRRAVAPPAGESPTSKPRSWPAVGLAHGRIRVGEEDSKVFWAEQIQAQIKPDREALVNLANLQGQLAALLGSKRAEVGGFGARQLSVSIPLKGLRPLSIPSLSVTDGYVQALPSLGLSGITGQVAPKRVSNEAAPKTSAFSLMFSGSYGGAREKLWNAVGEFDLGETWQDSQGTFGLRAERFTLDRIKDVLPPTVKAAERTSIDGGLGVRLANGVFQIKSNLDVVDLNLFHKALSSTPVENLSVSLRVDATLDPTARVLEVKQIEGSLRDLVGRLAGRLELAQGSYAFKDGRTWPWVPKINLVVDVPKLPCQKLLASFPKALVPRLSGFSLNGTFETHLETSIDYADLESVTLDGKVGIDGCKVQQVPLDVADLADADRPITHTVTVPPVWDEKGVEPEELVFVVGSDSEDFVPFSEVSPHLVNAFLTTEDSAFFKHRGFATREFRTALKRNLEDGRFKQGASSITMQMVKNLLLSQEKTLSRKLQELFLVWHIEHVLTKERIMELYLNAIEFGPRVYGIGPAARHYFGKKASELNPVEAAFFSSILPSPKRRYVHYCRGEASASWDKYVRRILGFMHKRGRLTDEELAAALTTPLVFDLQARTMTEKQCLEWVSRVTANPKQEAEPPSDADAAE